MKTNSDIFAKHVSLGVFIESGSCFGRSIERALDIGYKDVRSVEADFKRYQICANKFNADQRVRMWNGESVQMLPKMIDGLTTPAVWFLDAHPSGEGSYGQDYETRPELQQSNVLRAELAIIINRNVAGDVILIDDVTDDILKHAESIFRNVLLYDVEEDNGKVLEILK